MNKKIGIFDSGVGGLTVLKEMIRLLPNEEYIYLGDSKNNPYGEKEEKEIIDICLNIGNFLEKENSKILLIACNTATKACLKEMQDNLKIPVIGILKSGIDLAIKKSKTKKIAVIATNFTSMTKAYSETMKKNYPDKFKDYSFQEIGSKYLANMIETGLKDMDAVESHVKDLVFQIQDGYDTLILGCTHYPFVIDIFKKYYKGNIVNPALQMAIDVKKYLKDNNMLSENKKNNITIYTTGDKKVFYNNCKKLMDISNDNIKEITL